MTDNDISLNPVFASVAADQGVVPGGYYSLAQCKPYASPQPRDEHGRFVPKNAPADAAADTSADTSAGE